jgi:hypothetical protein
LITRRNGSHSKKATDETIITKHSIITSAAKNNKNLMENSNIFERANQVVKKRISSQPQVQKKGFLPSYKVETNADLQKNINKNLLNENKKTSSQNKQKINMKNPIPSVPSVGQGNSDIYRTSIHYQF